MDVLAVRQILDSALLRAALQAFLLASRDEGIPVKELAQLVGVSQATMYRWLAKGRRERIKNPRAELVYRSAAAGVGPCDHPRAFWMGRKRICLDCLACNFERELRNQRLTARAEQKAREISPPKFKPKGRKARAS